MQTKKGAFGFVTAVTGFTLLLLIFLGMFSTTTDASITAKSVETSSISRVKLQSNLLFLPFIDNGLTKVFLPFIDNGLTKVFIPGVIQQYSPDQTIFGVEADGFNPGLGVGRIVSSKANWIHVAGIWWPELQPNSPPTGTINWSPLHSYEQQFINAASNSINVILTVRGTPGWAQRYPPYACGPITPTAYTAFGDFLFALVSRYSAPPYNVQYYELGNEPDIDRNLLGDPNNSFGCWGDANDYYYGGATYADMLKEAYPRIKQANPNARVLVGGLLLDCDPRIALTNDINKYQGCRLAERQKPPRFLEGILMNGGGSFFDGVSFHAYDYADSLIQSAGHANWGTVFTRDGPVVLAKANYIRGLLDKYNAPDKSLVATEGALVLCSVCVYTDTLFQNAKALYLAEAYPASMAANIRVYSWYNMMGWPGRHTELFKPDLSPQPVFTALLTSRAVLADATYVRDITPADIGGASGVKGYVFRRNYQQIWTLWAYDGSNYTVTLPLGTSAVSDYLGNTIQVSPSGQIQMGVMNHPFIYVVW